MEGTVFVAVKSCVEEQRLNHTLYRNTIEVIRKFLPLYVRERFLRNTGEAGLLR